MLLLSEVSVDLRRMLMMLLLTVSDSSRNRHNSHHHSETTSRGILLLSDMSVVLTKRFNALSCRTAIGCCFGNV
jgi:hypothetical protein